MYNTEDIKNCNETKANSLMEDIKKKWKDQWEKEHPLCCNGRCACALHPEMCPSFNNCPNW